MSVDTSTAAGAIPPGAAPLFARAAAAGRRDDARLAAAVDDVLLGDDRLDDRTRAAIAARLAAEVAAIQTSLGRSMPDVLPRLADAGLLRDPDTMAALIGQVRLELLSDALAAWRLPDGSPALLARLAECGDTAIEAAARAYLLAANRRHGLPPDLYALLVWQVAAALVDDADAEVKGFEAVSSASTPFVGTGYRHDSAKDRGKQSAKFVADLPEAGKYEVRLAYTPNANRATAVPVTIIHKDGTASVVVNQQKPAPINGQWISLGTFEFEKGKAAAVTVTNDGVTDGHVIIDAVQWLPVK